MLSASDCHGQLVTGVTLTTVDKDRRVVVAELRRISWWPLAPIISPHSWVVEVVTRTSGVVMSWAGASQVTPTASATKRTPVAASHGAHRRAVEILRTSFALQASGLRRSVGSLHRAAPPVLG